MFETDWYVWTMVLVAVAGFAGAVGVILFRGGLGEQMNPRSARRAGTIGFLVLIAWAGVSAWMAYAGYYAGEVGGSLPWIPIVFTVFLVALLLAVRLPLVARVLDAPGGVVRLTAPHTLRVMGAVFLVVMAQGSLPAVFAIPAGLGDIAIGVAAPFVALRLARGVGRRGAVWFNILGLFDLVVALSIGFLAASGPFQLLDAQPPSDVLALLPLALIPTVAVPVAIALHIVTLRRLRSRPTPTDESENRLEAKLP